MEQPSLEALFADFYQRQNGRALEPLGQKLVEEALRAVGGELP